MVDGDALKIHKAVPERSLTSYQIVVPCEADGFVMEIAPGVFIGKEFGIYQVFFAIFISLMEFLISHKL